MCSTHSEILIAFTCSASSLCLSERVRDFANARGVLEGCRTHRRTSRNCVVKYNRQLVATKIKPAFCSGCSHHICIRISHKQVVLATIQSHTWWRTTVDILKHSGMNFCKYSPLQPHSGVLLTHKYYNSLHWQSYWKMATNHSTLQVHNQLETKCK